MINIVSIAGTSRARARNVTAVLTCFMRSNSQTDTVIKLAVKGESHHRIVIINPL
jgi:hypothetical protein